ncbi:MAG: hypothetical protein AB3N64_10785 [Puniceicoccaceae bacterium]
MNITTNKMIATILISGLLATPLLAGKADADQKAAERKAKTFLKWDEDGDQQLNKEEFCKMHTSWMEKSGKEAKQKELDNRFKNKDANGDGQVTFEEHFGMPLPK